MGDADQCGSLDGMHPDTPDIVASDRAVTRRRALSILGVGSVGLLAACASSSGSSSTATTAAAGDAVTTAGTSATTAAAPASTTATTTAGSTAAGATATTAGTSAATTAAATTAAAPVEDLTLTPRETAGPFAADGTNDNGDGERADVLNDARSVRRDIRSDLDGSNTQEGVPLALAMTVLDDATGRALPGAAVYVWHCNKEGLYSGYKSSMLGGDYSDRSYLRGVQIADANGIVNFQTILPGRYRGRAFHVHVAVYADGTYGQKLLTSQFAVDDDRIDALYAEAGYASALDADTDNGDDGVFRDGVEHQLMRLAGTVSSGLAGTFTVVV